MPDHTLRSSVVSVPGPSTATLLAVALASAAGADTITWSGGTDDVWGTAGNWDGGVVPGSDDIASFDDDDDGGTADLNGGDETIGGLLFDVTTGFTITDGAGTGSLTLVASADITNSGAGTVDFVDVDLDLAGDLTITNSGGDMTFDSDTTIQFESSSNSLLTIGGSGNVIIEGIISESGSGTGFLLKEDAGTLTLSGANTFNGGVTLAGGTILLGDADGLGTGDLSVTASASLGATGGAIAGVDNGIILNSGTTLNVVGSENLELTGLIRGSGQMLVNFDDGSDVLDLGGENTFEGGVVLTTGTLELGDDDALGVGRLTVAAAADGDGNLQSGTGDDTLNLANDVSIAATSILNVQGANGLELSGTITGDGGIDVGFSAAKFLTLSGTNTYTGDTRIQTDGSGIIVGDDAALGTGTLQVDPGSGGAVEGVLQASEDGIALPNDVEITDADDQLTVSGTSSLTLAGTISGSGALEFDGGGDMILRLTGTNTYSGGTTLSNGTLLFGNDEAIGTGGLTIDDGTIGVFNDSVTLDEAVTLGGDFSVADLGGETLTLSGAVDFGGAARTITTENDENFIISGALSNAAGTGLTKAGDGVLILDADNSGFASGVDLAAGSLGVGDDDAIGSADLDVTGDASIFAFGAGIDISEGIDLADGVTFTVTGANNLTLSGVINDGGSSDSIVQMSGTGILALGAGGANTFGGGVVLNSGEISLEGDGALGDGDVTVNGGTISTDTGGLAAISNDFDLASSLTLQGSENLSFSGIFSGAGGLTLRMDALADDVTLSGANTFTGDVAVTSGTLVLAGGSALADTVQLTLSDDADAELELSASETIGGLAGGGASGGNVVLGANTLTLSGSTDTVYAGVISGTGGLALTGSGIFQYDGAGTFTGATSIANGATLAGGGAVGGDLSVTDGGIFSVGDSTTAADFAIGGNLNVASGGTLALTLNVPTSTFDVIDVTGTATLASGSILDADLVTTGTYLSSGQQFTVLEADGGITDNGVLVQTDSATLTFSLAVDDAFENGDTSLSIEAFRAANAFSDPTYVSAGNNRRIGVAVDELVTIADAAGGSGEAANLVAQLQALDADDLNTALGELTPIEANVTTAIGTSNVSEFMSVQADYLAARRDGTTDLFMAGVGPGSLASAQDDPVLLAEAIAAEDEAADDDRAWGTYARLYGVSSDLDSADNRTGYEADSFGGQIGIDRRVSERLVIGLGLGFNNTDADLRDLAGDTEVDTFRIGPYATYSGDDWWLDASFTYGMSDYEQNRNVNIPGQGAQVARGDYDGEEYTAYLGGGFDVEMDGGWSLRPAASLRWSSFDYDAYTETGASPANMTVLDRSQDSLQGRLTASARYTVEGRTLKLVPELTAGLAYEFMDYDEVQARFAAGTTPFTLDVGSPEDLGVVLGAGVTLLREGYWSVYLRYEGLITDNGDGHGVLGGFTIRF